MFFSFGCTNPKPDLDGFWVSAYQIKTIPNQGIADYKKIMRIEGDSIFFRTTGDPKNGFQAWNIKSKFNQTLDGIEIEDETLDKIYVHKITKDSLVLSYKTQNSTREVFQKLNQTKSKINWDPKNKAYQWKGNSSFINTKFLNNGLFIDYLPETDEVSVGHWNTIKEENNLFIVFDKLNIIAISVDSLIKNKVYLSIHDEQKFNYTFMEQYLEVPNHLLGDWNLVSSDILRDEHSLLSNSFKWPTMDFLGIRKDSIITIKNKVKSTEKWTIGGANNLMIFPDVVLGKGVIETDTLTKKERIVLRNILKIHSLSENELVILAEYELVEFNGFEIKLTYQKEKTKANSYNK